MSNHIIATQVLLTISITLLGLLQALLVNFAVSKLLQHRAGKVADSHMAADAQGSWDAKKEQAEEQEEKDVVIELCLDAAGDLVPATTIKIKSQEGCKLEETRPSHSNWVLDGIWMIWFWSQKHL